jgi:hypothetical protein
VISKKDVDARHKAGHDDGETGANQLKEKNPAALARPPGFFGGAVSPMAA